MLYSMSSWKLLQTITVKSSVTLERKLPCFMVAGSMAFSLYLVWLFCNSWFSVPFGPQINQSVKRSLYVSYVHALVPFPSVVLLLLALLLFCSCMCLFLPWVHIICIARHLTDVRIFITKHLCFFGVYYFQIILTLESIITLSTARCWEGAEYLDYMSFSKSGTYLIFHILS